MIRRPKCIERVIVDKEEEILNLRNLSYRHKSGITRDVDVTQGALDFVHGDILTDYSGNKYMFLGIGIAMNGTRRACIFSIERESFEYVSENMISTKRIKLDQYSEIIRNRKRIRQVSIYEPNYP